MRFIGKAEQLILLIFIFLIPFQTRILLYTPFERLNEWNAMFFYLTDGLVGLLFISWFSRRFTKPKDGSSSTGSSLGFAHLPLLLFLCISTVSLLSAEHKGIGFYQLSKLGEFVFLFLYLTSNRHLDIKRISAVFVASAVLQSLLAIAQFITQSQIGLTHVEAGPLGIDIPGVAKIVVDGMNFIRGYGTFPHPNALAAFLLIGIFYFYLATIIRIHPSYPKQFSWKRLIVFVRTTTVLFILLLGLTITFSRTVLVMTVFGSLLFFILIASREGIRRTYGVNLRYLVTLFIIVIIALGTLFAPFLANRFSIEVGEQAVAYRIDDLSLGLSILNAHPLFGIGVGNYVPRLMEIAPNLQLWRYEPIHNIYLLIAVETGLLGLATFVFLLFYTIRPLAKNLSSSSRNDTYPYTLIHLILIILVLVLFATDHYFWSLQQGRLLFWVILGFVGRVSFSKSINSVAK